MFNKIIIIFVVLCFISVPVFASVSVNSYDLKNEAQFSKKSVILSDQELTNLNGQGWWGCVVATAAWTGLVMGAPAGFAANPISYGIALTAALKTMHDECNILKPMQ